MKKTLVLLFLLSAFSYYGSSQTASEIIDPPKRTSHGSSKTTRFGEQPSSVADYLSGQNLLAGETITFKRAVFKLLIDHKGKVTGATLFYGGITASVEEKLIKTLLGMPAWKTTLKAGEQSMIYLVVQIKDQVITTEQY